MTTGMGIEPLLEQMYKLIYSFAIVGGVSLVSGTAYVGETRLRTSVTKDYMSADISNLTKQNLHRQPYGPTLESNRRCASGRSSCQAH